MEPSQGIASTTSCCTIYHSARPMGQTRIEATHAKCWWSVKPCCRRPCVQQVKHVAREPMNGAQPQHCIAAARPCMFIECVSAKNACPGLVPGSMPAYADPCGDNVSFTG